MKININQVPSTYKVTLWWFDSIHASHAPKGIAEWDKQ